MSLTSRRSCIRKSPGGLSRWANAMMSVRWYQRARFVFFVEETYNINLDSTAIARRCCSIAVLAARDALGWKRNTFCHDRKKYCVVVDDYFVICCRKSKERLVQSVNGLTGYGAFLYLQSPGSRLQRTSCQRFESMTAWLSPVTAELRAPQQRRETRHQTGYAAEVLMHDKPHASNLSRT